MACKYGKHALVTMVFLSWHVNMVHMLLNIREPWYYYHWTMTEQLRVQYLDVFSVVPARRWLNTSWPAPLWPPRWDTGYWDESRNIHSGSLWPVCWSFVFSSCADTDTSDLDILPELVLFSVIYFMHHIKHLESNCRWPWTLRWL